MSGQEIGYVGFSPDYKSKKEHTLAGAIIAERQREKNRIWQEGYRAVIDAMRDATVSKCAWCAEGRPESLKEYTVGLADAITLIKQEADKLADQIKEEEEWG